MESVENQSEKPLAVITGASSGIGFHLARVFAKNGFDLIVVAEDLGIMEAASTFERFGAEVFPYQIDLTGQDGVDRLCARIKEQNRPVEALVVNAGVGVGGEFVETSLMKELNLIKLNVMSAVTLTKRVLRDMVKVGHGRILFTSSLAAETAAPYMAVYAASKAFLQSFAMAIRHEVKDRGIVVTALQPGATDTEFFERADMLDTKVGAGEKDDPAEVAQQGFDALMSGKDHVIAGSLMNKVQAVAGKLLSEAQAASLQARETKPGSAH